MKGILGSRKQEKIDWKNLKGWWASWRIRWNLAKLCSLVALWGSVSYPVTTSVECLGWDGLSDLKYGLGEEYSNGDSGPGAYTSWWWTQREYAS